MLVSALCEIVLMRFSWAIPLFQRLCILFALHFNITFIFSYLDRKRHELGVDCVLNPIFIIFVKVSIAFFLNDASIN